MVFRYCFLTHVVYRRLAALLQSRDDSVARGSEAGLDGHENGGANALGTRLESASRIRLIVHGSINK